VDKQIPMPNVPTAVLSRVPSALHDKPCAEEQQLVRADETILAKYPGMRSFHFGHVGLYLTSRDMLKFGIYAGT